MAALDRFLRAQDQPYEGFDCALAEMREGRKRGHWIWFIFPQLGGLGKSSVSRSYGIDGTSEARAYLQDPLLRSRFLEITAAVAGQVLKGTALPVLMGSALDALKLVSSLTLFHHVARDLFESEALNEYEEIADATQAILGAAAGEGYPACSYTLGVLRDHGCAD